MKKHIVFISLLSTSVAVHAATEASTPEGARVSTTSSDGVVVLGGAELKIGGDNNGNAAIFASGDMVHHGVGKGQPLTEEQVAAYIKDLKEGFENFYPTLTSEDRDALEEMTEEEIEKIAEEMGGDMDEIPEEIQAVRRKFVPALLLSAKKVAKKAGKSGAKALKKHWPKILAGTLTCLAAV